MKIIAKIILNIKFLTSKDFNMNICSRFNIKITNINNKNLYFIKIKFFPFDF